MVDHASIILSIIGTFFGENYAGTLLRIIGRFYRNTGQYDRVIVYIEIVMRQLFIV